MRLPPYGKQWRDKPPGAGVVVAIGPQAWAEARKRAYPVMVLPDDDDPANYDWPANDYGALVHETGPADDARLHGIAAALLNAGNPSVVAIRHSLLDVYGADPRVFFDRRNCYDKA